MKEPAVDLRRYGNKEKARILRRFFKTGPGEYAEGDIFLGITVPVLRDVADKHRQMGLTAVRRLLRSPIHEERFLALVILVERFRASDEAGRGKIYRLYLRHTEYINNWDLVDASAKYIVGAFLSDKSREQLYVLARSRLLWERRIAIIATFHFIGENDFKDTLKIAELLLPDKHDLIHKAVGWMLREVGKRDQAAEERFLQKHSAVMPRTMLRYAIERFPEAKRRAYLGRKVRCRCRRGL
ncbi:MAG: DNA alkylation repair protein [Candidatus Omnitrophota bacterium]